MTLKAVHADLQTLAQVSQQNFQQMSQNDKVLIDIVTTNAIHVRAMMEAAKEHGIDLQPFIDGELERRKQEMKEMAQKEEAVKKQVEDAMNKASSIVQPAENQEGDHEPPPDPLPTLEGDKDAPLIFGVAPDVVEETDVVWKDS